MAQHAGLAHPPDPVLPDVGLETAELRCQLRADVALDRLPRPHLDEPVHERLGEGLRVLESRL
jgi:hypothetical protein